MNDDICKEVEGSLKGVGRITRCLTPFVQSETPPPLPGAPADDDGGGASPAPASAGAHPVARLVRAGLAVLRSLAYSDTVRARMCAAPTDAPPSSDSSAPSGLSPLDLILCCLSAWCAASATVAEAALGCVANLALRAEANKAAIFSRGGLGLVAAALRAHPDSAGVARASCLAVRNVVVRSPERVQAAFDEGLEQLLQRAYGRHPGARDVAYACLRDMGCEYAETTTGRAQAERAARALAAGDISVQ